MESFQKALSALGSVKTPISITALAFIVFYYLASQLLTLPVFATLTQAGTGAILESVLSKIFWLAVLGLIFGGVLFALPILVPKRNNSNVEIVRASLNEDLGTHSGSDKN